VQGTRERILSLIVERREMRVEELAAELGITPTAVRRHLDNLRADGLVDARTVKQATGRPYYAFFPTEDAQGRLPRSYADLLRRMLEGIGEREEVVGAVMESVAESLAARHRVELAGAGVSPEARIDMVTHSLREDGILDAWHAGEDGFHLVNGTCPYLKAAEISSLPCESDRKAIELLLDGEVEQLHRIVDGSPVCEYLVRALHGPQPLTLMERA
jgi:predicted ArsR family transcriptional regulator